MNRDVMLIAVVAVAATIYLRLGCTDGFTQCTNMTGFIQAPTPPTPFQEFLSLWSVG